MVVCVGCRWSWQIIHLNCVVVAQTYRKVVVAQGSLGPGRKVTGSVGNLSTSLASYCYISIYL